MRSASKSLDVNIEALVRAEILDLKPYLPGKPVEELERQIGIQGALKLASNENPLGPSPRAIEAIEAAARQVNRYPDGSSFYLTGRLATHVGVEPEQIVVGSGSNEIIELLCHLFLAPGDQAIVGDVTFPMYAIAVTVCGGVPVRVPLRDLRFDLEAMADAITPRTRIVFISNPNNPTGTMVTAAEVERFMARVPENVLVVFDEAYYEYVRDPEYPRSLDYLDAGRHVCILRTFSKAYSLAGLRIGYGITHPQTVALVHRVRMPFNVTSIAQSAALASLDDQGHVERSRRVNDQGMKVLIRDLTTLGCTVTESRTNFLLVRFPVDARPLIKQLEQRGIIVRGMLPFGMDEHYARISIGVAAENERLILALRELLA